MFDEKLKITGVLRIRLQGPDGQLLFDRTLKNLVVTAGKSFIASRMASASAAVMGWIAVGSGSTAADPGDTGLETEITRVAVTVSGGTPSGDSVTYSAVFGAGVGTGLITEAGILNAAAVGTLLSRTVFGLVTKTAGDSLTIDWTITIG